MAAIFALPIPKAQGAYDTGTLSNGLSRYRKVDPDLDEITVAPDDGIRHQSLIHTMDAVVGARFPSISLSDS